MSNTATQDTFAILLTKLLSGEFICEYSAEPLYNYLQDPNMLHNVDDYLRKIGRALSQTQDSTTYFAIFRNINDPSVKAQIRKHYSELINDLEPLVRWLRLALSAEKTGNPIQPGDTLRESDLIRAIENAPALVDELERLSRTRLFNNSATGAKKQLDAILRRLSERGYLISTGASGAVFIATGKWGRLYEELAFIASHEQLDELEDEFDETQKEMKL